MIINKYLIEKIGHYANPRPLIDTKIRDSRRLKILDALGSKMSLKTWNMFYNLISLKVNPKRKQSNKKYKKISSVQAKKLLDILGLDYEIEKGHINAYTYTEKNSTEKKYAIGVYGVNNELYDSNFRLIKIDRIVKATPLSDCHQDSDEVQNAKSN